MPHPPNPIRSMMMKTVLCLSVVLMLAACGGKSETAAPTPPKQEANSPGEQVIQNREKAVNAAKSVEEMQKKQAEQIDEQAK